MSNPRHLPTAEDASLVEFAFEMRESEPLNLPLFTANELQAMHRYCLKYRDLVRGSGTPTVEQSEYFMAFQQVCYALGAAYE